MAKQYETLSKEEIMAYFMNNSCIHEGECPHIWDLSRTCNVCLEEYLMKEVKLVPRISTINTVKELEEAYIKWEIKQQRKSFYEWLKEDIVVE